VRLEFQGMHQSLHLEEVHPACVGLSHCFPVELSCQLASVCGNNCGETHWTETAWNGQLGDAMAFGGLICESNFEGAADVILGRWTMLTSLVGIGMKPRLGLFWSFGMMAFASVAILTLLEKPHLLHLLETLLQLTDANKLPVEVKELLKLVLEVIWNTCATGRSGRVRKALSKFVAEFWCDAFRFGLEAQDDGFKVIIFAEGSWIEGRP